MVLAGRRASLQSTAAARSKAPDLRRVHSRLLQPLLRAAKLAVPLLQQLGPQLLLHDEHSGEAKFRKDGLQPPALLSRNPARGHSHGPRLAERQVLSTLGPLAVRLRANLQQQDWRLHFDQRPERGPEAAVPDRLSERRLHLSS